MQGIFQINRHNPTIAKLELTLHKPNGEQIGVLNDATDRRGKFSFGRFNELELSVPRYVERKHQQVKYNEFDLIRDKFLVKATYGDMFSEFFIVTDIQKTGGQAPYKHIKLKSRQYELNNLTLRNLEELSCTVREILEIILKGTNWSIGDIDESLELIINEDGSLDHDKIIPKRSFEETKITILNLLYKIAETFGVILQFDTFNRKINVTTPEKAEIDKGLFASYGKFIKELDEDIQGDTATTCLYVYGRDGIGIEKVNPTGKPYLEDFSYYMQGYETDEEGNVISSSPYMSDSLCQAIIDFNLLYISKEPVFESYLYDLQPLNETLAIRNEELETLNDELGDIQDNLDNAKAHDKNQIATFKQQETNKLNQINAKQSQIDSVQSQIDAIQTKIKSLQDELSLEKNFTQSQIAERNDFVIDGEYNDENIDDEMELYEATKDQLKKMREPLRDLDLSLVQFLNAIESHNDWDKIGLGYVIRTDYEPLDIEFKALITEINIGFDSNDLSIAISNVNYKDNKTQFLEMLYGTAVSTADRLKKKDKEWSDNINKTDYLEEFLENPWETSRQRILAGSQENINISRRGIIITNPKFANEQVILQSGIIALSRDFGENWDTAISPYGVAASVVIGKLIMGEKLEIGDEEGTFEIKGNLLTIKDRQDKTRVRLGEYQSEKFGLQLMNKSGNQVVLDENGILQSWQQGAADNVNSNHSLTLNVYVPNETLSIRQAKLNFKLLPFRSYSGTTESGGSTVPTTSSGGGVQTTTASGGGSTPTSSSGGGVSKSTLSGGGGSTTSAQNSPYPVITLESGLDTTESPAPAGKHFHRVPVPTSLFNHTHTVQIQPHSHSFETPNHSHTVTISPHSHSITLQPHTHTVQIQPHTHEIKHDIYTSTTATGVGIIINGTNRTSALGGKFNSNKVNLDIAQYLQAGQWNEITLTSDRLGRIDATVFIQAFISTGA